MGHCTIGPGGTIRTPTFWRLAATAALALTVTACPGSGAVLEEDGDVDDTIVDASSFEDSSVSPDEPAEEPVAAEVVCEEGSDVCPMIEGLVDDDGMSVRFAVDVPDFDPDVQPWYVDLAFPPADDSGITVYCGAQFNEGDAGGSATCQGLDEQGVPAFIAEIPVTYRASDLFRITAVVEMPREMPLADGSGQVQSRVDASPATAVLELGFGGNTAAFVELTPTFAMGFGHDADSASGWDIDAAGQAGFTPWFK